MWFLCSDSSVYTLRIGFNDSSDGLELTVEKIIRHELYFQSESYHDIALVFIKRAIHITSRLDIVCLPSHYVSIGRLIGRRGTVLGFSDSHYNRYVSQTLKQIEIKIIYIEEFDHKYAVGDRHNIPVGIQDCMVCATALGPNDVAHGDSGQSSIDLNKFWINFKIFYYWKGGPLIVTQNEVQYLIGIVSFSRSSGSVSIPGVYTNVLYYRKWILNKLSKNWFNNKTIIFKNDFIEKNEKQNKIKAKNQN